MKIKKTVEFVKMTAAGNDFVMIDNRLGAIPRYGKNQPALARFVCDRKFGVGADGMILLENSRRADFRMRYFNADGSEVSMCGNGARSIARFAEFIGAVSKKCGAFETPAGVIKYQLKKNSVRIKLSEPRGYEPDFGLAVGGKNLRASFIDTGVPHVVVFVGELAKIDVEGLGRTIRYHKKFAPAGGANANFVKIKNRAGLEVRTYERGVEAETLACGTGVTASAVIAGIKKTVRPPVNCLTRGGDTLTVDYKLSAPPAGPAKISDVYLEGPARIVFAGRLDIV